MGHSWGAPVGAVMAAIDDRDIWLVLVTGRPSWTGFLRHERESWVRNARDRVGEEDWQTYLALMAPFDMMSVIGQVESGRLYLQYGTADDVVPEPVASELVDAVPGASVGWYDAGHALNDTAMADRVAWLVEQLGLDAVPPEILATVGLPDE